MNILLAGGSGFIGRNIRESFLAEKYNIIAPSRGELDLFDEDAARKFFLNNKIDAVIHCAAKPTHRNAPDPTRIFYTDMRMFMNVLRNAAHFKKMLVISSGAIYDKRYYKPQMKEDYFDEHIPADEHPFYCYVSAKMIEKSLNIAELRIFSIFGKYEDYAIRFISNAICKTLFDLPITIKQNRKMSYLYIDDLMPILDYFLQNEAKHKSYNIAPQETITLCELAEKVKKISGKNLPIIVAKEGMDAEYTADNSRLNAEIPELKFTNIDAAVKQLYDWYSQNKNLINRENLLFDK